MADALMTSVHCGLIQHESDGQGTQGLGDEAVRARGLVLPDKVKFRPPVQIDPDVLQKLRDYRVVVDDEGAVVREFGYDGNLYIAASATGRSLISGSLRNWAVDHSIADENGPFGPADVGVVLNALALRYGLSVPDVRSAWLSYLEVACDLDVDRDVAEYARALGDLPRATTHRHGTTTVRYETDRRDLIVYRKGPNRLRVEVRFKKPAAEFGRRLRVGQLADPSFRDDLARRWVARARTLPFRRAPRSDTRPTTYADRVRAYAVEAIESSGGLDLSLIHI